MRPIRTERLILRNWEDRDRELFHRINSDDRVMEFFPFRRDRAECDAILNRLRADIAERGYGFSAVEIAATGECIGFCGLKEPDLDPAFPAGTIEIGWRLAPEFWGFGYVTEAAEALLDFGFETLGQTKSSPSPSGTTFARPPSWSASACAATPPRDFDHPGVPDTHPELKRHVLYRLSRQDWQARSRRNQLQ